MHRWQLAWQFFGRTVHKYRSVADHAPLSSTSVTLPLRFERRVLVESVDVVHGVIRKMSLKLDLGYFELFVQEKEEP